MPCLFACRSAAARHATESTPAAPGRRPCQQKTDAQIKEMKRRGRRRRRRDQTRPLNIDTHPSHGPVEKGKKVHLFIIQYCVLYV